MLRKLLHCKAPSTSDRGLFGVVQSMMSTGLKFLTPVTWVQAFKQALRRWQPLRNACLRRLHWTLIQ